MVFSSIIFLFLFLPVVLAVHFVIPRSYRNVLLLLVSLFFYAWGETFFVLIMLVSVVANYLFGLWLNRVKTPAQGKRVVAAAVMLNLGLLVAYKYANFFVDNLNVLIRLCGLPEIPLGPVHLPIGISFFTFQALSYVVDVYRGQVPAERRFVNVALYIALFPQLIAGPIIRYRDVAAQIVKRTITRSGFAYGIGRFIVGLGKKVLVANVLGEQVDRIHAIPAGEIPSGVAWLAGFYFMQQLYFDFSGYSDMAIGLGRMFGFKFRENFNYPHISTTLTEFWQRWHISLSTWFRDYLFIPLGGYRVTRKRAYMNLMVVFFLCGLWHGASWNFILFGTFQGAVLLIERIVRVRRIKFLQGFWGHVYVIGLFYIMGSLFRCESVAALGSFFGSLLGFVPHPNPAYHVGLYINWEVALAAVASCLGVMPFVPWVQKKVEAWKSRLGPETRSAEVVEVGRQVACLVLLVAIFLVSSMKIAAGTHNPFIYFRF